MNSYYFGLYSRSEKQVGVIQKFVNTKTFSTVCFPAKIYLNPKNKKKGLPNEILFENSYDFNTDMLPEDYYSKRNIYFGLHSLNGISTTFNCYFKRNPIIMSNAILEFDQTYVSKKIIDLSIFQKIIYETVNVFDIHMAEVVVKIEDNKSWSITCPQSNPIKLYFNWITFLGNDICDFIGRDIIFSIKGCSKIQEVENGILIILQDDPYDPNNPEHIEHRDYILDQLKAIPMSSTID